MELLKKYLVGSFVFHLGILIFACIVSYFDSRIKKSFIVFGAHSRKPSFVSYKKLKAVPFIGPSSRAKGSQRAGAHRHQKMCHRTIKNHHVRDLNKKSYAKVIKKQRHRKQRLPAAPRAVAAPESASVVHELADDIKIVHKKPARIKRSKKHAITHTRETNVAHNEQKEHQPIEPIHVAPPVEEKPLKGPEKVSEPERKPLEKPEQSIACQSEEPVLPDDHMPESECVQNDVESADSAADYAGFNLIGNYDQKDLITYQRHVQREVDRLWRPPLGVPRGTICTVMFTIGTEGIVENFEILKRSDVIIYDLSIIRVAKNFQFDKSLWGKQFKIDFRQ
ncbi:MAG: hypothetical protein WC365_02955 [Candidatus Babeliales bacterium]